MQLEEELPYIIESEDVTCQNTKSDYDWKSIEEKQVQKWINARNIHKQDVQNVVNYRVESLKNNFRNRIRSLEQQIQDAYDENVRRMKQSELETVKALFDKKMNEITTDAETSDIYTTLLFNGVISVIGG